LQERTLLNGGLGKDFNPVITKLVLGKHGYSEKQEIQHTGEKDNPLVIVVPNED
jgi:hypothetical protein